MARAVLGFVSLPVFLVGFGDRRGLEGGVGGDPRVESQNVLNIRGMPAQLASGTG